MSRKHLRRGWLAAFLSVIMAASAVLAGCGSSETEDKETEVGFTPKLDTQKEVTINVVGAFDNFPSLETVALDFAEYYPNVTVSYSKVDDYTNVRDMLLTDNPEVDIFMSNNTYIKNSETAKEVAVNLADESLGFDLSALDPGVFESAKSEDGGLYRLPIYSICSGLIVNVTLLQENGLEVPTCYSEFVSCCEALEKAGYTPIYGYNPEGKTNLSQGLYGSMVMTMAAKANTDGTLDDAVNRNEEGSSEIYREALVKIEQFASLGFYSRETSADITDSYEGAILRFFEGDVPFLAATSETMSGTAKRESKSENFTANPFTYTFIASPLGESGSYVYVNSGEGLAINKNGANLEYAEEFLRFYMSVTELNKSADVKGMLSTSCEADSAEAFPNLKMDDADYISYISDFYLESVQSKTVNELVRLVSDEGVSAEEALSRYDEILAGFEEE